MSLAGTPPVKGYLVVKVLEAAGHNSDDAKVWDASFTEGFVKVEIRGGPKTIKKTTAVKAVADNAIEWDEQLALEVHEGASELRMMLCREKKTGDTRTGTSIVAACGIYMRDIMDAVPIDKYFELFKPGVGAEGGFIRVSMNYLLPDQVRSSGNGELAPSDEPAEPAKKGGGGRGNRTAVLLVGVLAAAAAFAAVKLLGGKEGARSGGKGGSSSSSKDGGKGKGKQEKLGFFK